MVSDATLLTSRMETVTIGSPADAFYRHETTTSWTHVVSVALFFCLLKKKKKKTTRWGFSVILYL